MTHALVHGCALLLVLAACSPSRDRIAAPILGAFTTLQTFEGPIRLGDPVFMKDGLQIHLDTGEYYRFRTDGDGTAVILQEADHSLLWESRWKVVPQPESNQFTPVAVHRTPRDSPIVITTTAILSAEAAVCVFAGGGSMVCRWFPLAPPCLVVNAAGGARLGWAACELLYGPIGG